jgi:hypothetical protein
LGGVANVGMKTGNLLVEALLIPSVLARQHREDRLALLP